MRAVIETKPLGEVLRLEYGKPLPSEARINSGRFAVYGANGIKARTDVFYSSNPSIIVGRKGSAGQVTLTEDRFWPLDVTYFVEFDRDRHDLKYLYYMLSWLGLPRLARGIKPGLNREEAYAERVPAPPLPEQQRIVAILDEAFEAIAIATANAEKNLANTHKLFDRQLDQLFGELQDVKQLTLTEAAATFGRGKSRHRPRNDLSLYGGAYPFVQTGDVRNANRYIATFSQTYNEKGLAQSKLWPKGTVCITIAANIAETAILGLDACFPDSMIGMIVNKSVTSNEYVEYLLRYFKKLLQSHGKGSAQDNINLATFESQKFPFPSLPQQELIVSNLNELDREVRHLELSYTRKLTLLAELRQSLLARAFAGELTASPAIAA